MYTYYTLWNPELFVRFPQVVLTSRIFTSAPYFHWCPNFLMMCHIMSCIIPLSFREDNWRLLTWSLEQHCLLQERWLCGSVCPIHNEFLRLLGHVFPSKGLGAKGWRWEMYKGHEIFPVDGKLLPTCLPSDRILGNWWFLLDLPHRLFKSLPL